MCARVNEDVSVSEDVCEWMNKDVCDRVSVSVCV
jgi:hypothetical protein